MDTTLLNGSRWGLSLFSLERCWVAFLGGTVPNYSGSNFVNTHLGARHATLLSKGSVRLGRRNYLP